MLWAESGDSILMAFLLLKRNGERVMQKAVAFMTASLMIFISSQRGDILQDQNNSAPKYQDSPFGIFCAFSANEYPYFKSRMGFTDEQYWTWTENHIRNLGVHWTRSNLQLVWDIVEPVIGGGYYWDNNMLTDPIIKRIYRPENLVNWVGVFHEGGFHPGKPPLRNPLDYPDEYTAFVRTAVERYDGDGINDAASGVMVKYWQVGNEVFIWRDSGSSIHDYIQFVRLIGKATKQADPEASIVLIAPTDGFKVDSFLLQVIDTLAVERSFDVIDIHHWGTAQNWRMTAIPQYTGQTFPVGTLFKIVLVLMSLALGTVGKYNSNRIKF